MRRWGRAWVGMWAAAATIALVGVAAFIGTTGDAPTTITAGTSAQAKSISPPETTTEPESVEPPPGATEWDGLVVDDYAHENEPWAPELFAELNGPWIRSDPFLGVRLLDFKGQHLNIRNGHRVSYTPTEPELTVWFFGGSTMFGIGQRDSHTIPSVIARRAEQDGVRIRAVNFGVSGYENWRSLEQFQQALTSSGEPKPDLAVFYEGINDWGLGSERMDLGDARSGAITRLALSEEERQQVRDDRDNAGQIPPGTARDELATELSADQYRRGSELVDHLASSFDVPVTRFWQPSPYAKRTQRSDARLWERLGFDPAFLPKSTRLYADVRIGSGVDTVDLTTVFDKIDQPIYFDGGHTNELGARIVGEAMYEQLGPQLRVLNAGG